MLMGILGNLEFVRDTLEDAPAVIQEALREAEECARRSADLTHQILTFARRQPIAPRLLDLNDLVAAALPMLRRLIGTTIELSWSPSPRAALLLLDPSQVHQVLANLVVNARDALRGGGRIVVATECAELDDAYCASHPGARPGSHVALVVRDSGVGMTPEVAARIFEPFFTTKQQGTGLGLSIVHGIIAQNGGHIDLQSHPGDGTTFKLWLPGAEPLPPDSAARHAETLPRGHEVVLVVEDEPAVRHLVVSGLRRLGYSVQAVSTPAEAFAVMSSPSATIDVVVTDMVMPGMNGIDFISALRARAPGLPCVLMTGFGEVDLEADEGPGTRLLRKPFDMRALAETVRAVLDDTAGRRTR